MNQEKIAYYVRGILNEIGEDPQRIGLINTPLRVAKMYEELFRGYDSTQAPTITVFPNNVDGVAYDDIITDEGNFHSFCEHHMALFTGRYYFGYIPDSLVIGLSKIARIVNYYGARLQIQERLGRQIVNKIDEMLKSKGTILILEASHTCKSIRGVKKDGTMRTIVTTGLFRSEPLLEQKFISLIK